MSIVDKIKEKKEQEIKNKFALDVQDIEDIFDMIGEEGI